MPEPGVPLGAAAGQVGGAEGCGRSPPSLWVPLGRMRSAPSLRFTQQVGMPGAAGGGTEPRPGGFGGLFLLSSLEKCEGEGEENQQFSEIPLQLFIYVLPVSVKNGFVSQLRSFILFSIYSPSPPFSFFESYFSLCPAFASLIPADQTVRKQIPRGLSSLTVGGIQTKRCIYRK